MTDATPPLSKTKAQLEELVKENGGSIFQSENARKNIVVIADKSPSPELSVDG